MIIISPFCSRRLVGGLWAPSELISPDCNNSHAKMKRNFLGTSHKVIARVGRRKTSKTNYVIMLVIAKQMFEKRMHVIQLYLHCDRPPSFFPLKILRIYVRQNFLIDMCKLGGNYY